MRKNELMTRLHEQAMDVINEALIVLQDQTIEVGEIPRRFDSWDQDEDSDVLWWDTSMTGGEITEPPSYIGGPESSDWPFEKEDEKHMLWVPLPKLARNKP